MRGTMLWWLLAAMVVAEAALDDAADRDGDGSRKVLGSSVVTSVSVIMDAGNGSKIYADAVGKPMSKPLNASDVASPINLLNPDRYEFYTFDDTGNLVKRLMTLEEIRDIIATGDGDGFSVDTITANGFIPEKRVNDVVNNVQNVLKEEMKTHKDPIDPQLDTPNVSDSWSMILPAVFGNSGEDIKPEPPITHVTPDTIMIEPGAISAATEMISTTEKIQTLQTKTIPKTTTTSTEKAPMINVEIITNSNSTTEKTVNVESAHVVQIKPYNDLEMTKDNSKPVFFVNKSTKRPSPVKVTTFRPTRSTGAPLITRTTPKSTTAQIVRDATAQPSTVYFERVPPPQPSTSSTTTTTTTTTTTQEPTTSTTEQLQTTSIQPTTRLTEVPEITTETESTTTVEPSTEAMTTNAPTTSTFGSLSTFFMVGDNTAPPQFKTSPSEDLSTLSTEYITVKTVTNQVPKSTTESQSTDRTTSNILDQLLLTSTNIYEINSELSDAAQTTESVESTTSEDKTTTERFLIKITNPPTEEPASTTTDQTFIDTIEQLISQAIGTPAPPVEVAKESLKVQEMMMNSTNKTMPQIMKETATVASNLIGNTEESMTTTTEVPTSTMMVDDDLLSESVGSLLSQVYGQGSTTLEYDTTTIVPTTTESSESTTTLETTSFIPHIINITIIRNEIDENNRKNQTKPAKADLSLEMEYEDLLEEMKKNSTLAAIIQNQNQASSNQTQEALKNETTSTTQKTTEATTSNQTQEIVKTETTSAKPNEESLKSEATSSTQQDQIFDDVSSTTESTTMMTTEAITTTESLPTTTSTITNTSTSTEEPKPSIVVTINEEKNKTDTNWTLVSTIAPHSESKLEVAADETSSHVISSIVEPPPPVDLVPKPLQGFGLEDSTAKLDSDIYQFVQLCNELAFGFWKSVTTGISSARSVVVSPFAATSLLAMVFLGARGATSGEMNEILKLDDMVTFNPHLIFKNVSESVETSPDSGVAVSAIIRELYSDRSKGKLLGFYKERVRQFYDGHVEEASFREIGDVIRRRTNLLVKKNTDGKIPEFLKDGSIYPKPPLAGVSISIFQTDCSHASTEGRNGELHFVVLPSIRQRRLIPIPAITYQSGFLAGYEPSLDATAAALGTKDQPISTIFIIPGQQGLAAPGDGLARLEKRLVESSFKKGAWARLLRALIPRPGLELQIPRFQHRSLINATQSLKRMGLHDLFDSRKADLKGLNGAAHELHLSDVLQINEFATCGERRIGEAHHREVYPATAERKGRMLEWELEEVRDYQRAFHDPLHDPSYLSLPLPLRPRQARLPEPPRLRFDRPFLYFVRHNPSGLILHMGRFHPRLLP